MKLNMTNSLLRRVASAALGTLAALTLASCGGGGGSPGAIPGQTTGPTVGTVTLLFSSSSLKSAGQPNTEVTVTALVKNANNVAVADVPVEFTATSGALSGVEAKTDKNGQAKATLSTAGDRTNRKITVSVKAGTQATSGVVEVTDTSVVAVGPKVISAGTTGDYTISVKDSANVAVSNVPVTFSTQNGGTVTVLSSNGGSATAPLTNTLGQVVLRVTPPASGSDVLTVTAQGTSDRAAFSVNSTKLSVAVVDSTTSNTVAVANTGTCQKIVAHYEVGGALQSGSIGIVTSRGSLYSDKSCGAGTELTSSSVVLTNGDTAPVFVKSNTAGVATVTAAVAGGASVQTDVKFVAALTPTATITLQGEPAIVGTTGKSAVTAIVRDGTGFNNFVEGANVEFSIVNDPSGGALSNPSIVTTQTNGSASIFFIAGAADTPKDGVTIQAKIQGTTKTATATLTVAKKSLFISAGTGNKLATPSSSSYQQDYSVLVTDAAGNAVPNVTVTASIVPTRYAKGFYLYNSTGIAKQWVPVRLYTCDNEDVTRNGILDAGEDTNLNNILDPGLPVAVSASGTTDASGVATVSLVYPRDRANWVEVQLTIRASVSGTEALYQTTAYFLPALSTDVGDQNVAPPGNLADISSLGLIDANTQPIKTGIISPYGFHACNVGN